MGNGSRFILKKKSDEFAEKMKVKQPKAKISNEVMKANLEFRSYITDNRILGIFSKHGELENMKNFGKYINLVLDDAKEDFLKDNDISDMEPKAQKQVFSVGGLIAQKLKGYL
jgi:hypothetical protein